MPLFIDQLPIHCWTDNIQTPPRQYWSVDLPVFVIETGLVAPPVGSAIQQWFFDTGCFGEAFAWRQHLVSAGINPDQNQWPSSMVVTSSVRGRTVAPVRQPDLWLVSNAPALQNTTYRIALERGIPFRNVPTLPVPQFNRPLIGMRAMRRAGLRVEIDLQKDTVSLWTPDPVPSP
jgi:hypothetical protein